MKRIYIYALGILAMTSCQYQVDNSNPFKVAEAIYDGLSQNDSTILKQVFIHQMDSLNESSTENINKAQTYFRKNENVQLFKIDTSSNFVGSVILYLKKGKVFHRIRTYYNPDSTRTVKPTDFYFTNINESCEEDKNTPYNPSYSIDFKRISWHTDYYSKTFKDGAIELQNNTDIDLNYIKFRVILKNGSSSWAAKTFLNQTVESYKPIYKGDIATIEVPGMTDYFTGFTINKDELFFDAELIEVKPKPESFWCKTLEELEAEIIENSN
jgi:hypothetical protein